MIPSPLVSPSRRAASRHPLPGLSIVERRHPASRASAWRAAALCLCVSVCTGWAESAAAVWVRISADEVVNGEIRAGRTRAELDAEGRFEVSVAEWGGPGEEWLRGGWELSGVLNELTPTADGFEVLAGLDAWGLHADLAATLAEGGLRAELRMSNQPLGQLAGLPGAPAQLDWLTAGQFGARLSWNSALAGALTAEFQVQRVAFDSPDGRFAGEGLSLSADASMTPGDGALALAGQVSGGQLLLDDFYRDFGDGGLAFDMDAYPSGHGWVIAPLSLADDGTLAVEAGLAWGVDGLAAGPSLQVNRLDLRFPGAYGRYLEPMASVYTLDGLQVTGRLSWHGEWVGGRFRSGDLDLTDISVADVARGRFALTGLEARLRPGDYRFDSSLAWRGLVFGRVNLGGGRAEIDSEPGVLALRQPLSLQVTGGAVDIERLRVTLPRSGGDGKSEPDVLLRAQLRDLDVARLTEAFGWPVFSGRLSGEIPDVTLDDGVLELDGEIRLQVFDGQVAMSGLRVERLFGVLPSLSANLVIDALDLEQLTGTFEFGRISGLLSGRVDGLRMLDWRPVAFDAWVGTPEGSGGSNDISRQAVNRLTAIGGGSATAALTGPLLRMFSNFSYRRLGLGCRLSNNVCALRGLAEEGDSVVILEGAGIPKITIRAFNRNLDWPQMVSNLVAVSEGDDIVVGKQRPNP